jgi:hypothetical protein
MTPAATALRPDHLLLLLLLLCCWHQWTHPCPLPHLHQQQQQLNLFYLLLLLHGCCQAAPAAAAAASLTAAAADRAPAEHGKHMLLLPYVPNPLPAKGRSAGALAALLTNDLTPAAEMTVAAALQ